MNGVKYKAVLEENLFEAAKHLRWGGVSPSIRMRILTTTMEG